MNEVFELHTTDVVKLVFGNDIDAGHRRRTSGHSRRWRHVASGRFQSRQSCAERCDAPQQTHCQICFRQIIMVPVSTSPSSGVSAKSGPAIGSVIIRLAGSRCNARCNDRARTLLSVPLSYITRRRLSLRSLLSVLEASAIFCNIGDLAPADDEPLSLLRLSLRRFS